LVYQEFLNLHGILLDLSHYMLKKATILFFLSVFLFNSVGYFIVFKIVQSKIKHEMMSEIRNNLSDYNPAKLIFDAKTEKEISWKEEGKEFEYKDQRYDIIKKVRDGESLIIYCIEDKKESMLWGDLNKHVKSNVISNVPERQKSADDISSNVIKLYFNPEAIIYTDLSACNIITWRSVSDNYQAPALLSDFPPPDHSQAG
jgi:hypothetical protein